MIKRIFALSLVLLTLLGSCNLLAEYNYDDSQVVVAALGDEGDFVYAVKWALVDKGYLDQMYIDDRFEGFDYFDEATEQAVKSFQYAKGYEMTGELTKIQFYWLHRAKYNEWFDRSYIVYITANGSRYHTWDCRVVANSRILMPISINIANELGYQPCRICNPAGY